MLILLISFITSIVFLLATIIYIAVNQPQKQKGELLRLSETVLTAVMGGMLIALGFLLLFAKYTDSAIGGTNQSSYLFIGCFAVICEVIGCGVMLYTFLKKVIIYEREIMFISIFGVCKKLAWEDIAEVKIPMLSTKLTLIGNNIRFTVGGEPKSYKKFIKIAKGKIKKELASDALNKLMDRLVV